MLAVGLTPPLCVGCILSWQSRDGSEAALQSNDQEYWAKGTGFGSGSLRSGWNMDQVREKQKKNERQMELIFKVSTAV